jgi:uncharacterized protein (TIGR02246 family)
MTTTIHPTPDPTIDPTTVAALQIDQLERAWNQADGAAFGSVFAEDADFVDIRGTHHQGAAAIGHGHQAIFDTIYAGSTVRFELDRVRLVAPGCIVAVVASTLDAPTGPLAGVNNARVTMLLTEQGGRWKVTAFHNTLVREG